MKINAARQVFCVPADSVAAGSKFALIEQSRNFLTTEGEDFQAHLGRTWQIEFDAGGGVEGIEPSSLSSTPTGG